MGLRTFIQRVSAGNQFDGTAPVGDPESGSDIEKLYPIEAAGGLFDFELTAPAVIDFIQLSLGGQTVWTLSIVDPPEVGSTEYVIWVGTNEEDFATLESDRVPIFQGQTVKLVTTGATDPLVARITLKPVV